MYVCMYVGIYAHCDDKYTNGFCCVLHSENGMCDLLCSQLHGGNSGEIKRKLENVVSGKVLSINIMYILCLSDRGEVEWERVRGREGERERK